MAAFPAIFCLLFAVIVSGQHVDIAPSEAVRRIGDSVKVLCKVPYAIDSCRMSVGGTTYRLIPENQEGDVVYEGQGLKFGECGAHIKHIREEWNGNVSCVLPPQTGSIELTANMRLLVARAPGPAQLVSSPQGILTEGDVLSAQCIVPDGRPAAKISWFLDEQQILSGTHQPVVTVSGGDLQTISQNVTLTLSADDATRRLACRAEHEALDAPTVATRQLIVQYPPKRQDPEGVVTVFGLKLGAEGRLNVTVRAEPAPRAEWSAADTRLAPPQASADGRLVALEPVPLGNGYYNVTLVLTHVEKEDVDRAYYLAVSNERGREEFTLRLSTMDEPAGVELEAGAIVGIVVAVLALLLAVSLVVFAKATDRWCFAGRSHRTDIPDGADSEAPLPPPEDGSGAENPSHDHGDYITANGDKVPEKKPDTAV